MSAAHQAPARVERELFTATTGIRASSAAREVRGAPRSGVGLVHIWLAAAVALVAGILIGFWSGFNAGQRAGAALFSPGIVSETPAVPDAPRPAATPASESATSGQTFTEGAVGPGRRSPEGEGGPARVDPEPIDAPPGPPATDAEPREAAVPLSQAAAQPAPQAAAPEPEAPPPTPAARPAPAANVPSSGPGSLQVLSRPAGAQVVLDGRAVGQTPLVIPEIQGGRHDVRLELPGFRRWATSVEVTPGERTRVAASLEQ